MPGAGRAGAFTTGAALVALIASCGGADKPAKPSGGKLRGLPQPIYPTCRVSGFARPTARQAVLARGQGPVWTLNYTHRRAAQIPPGDPQTTVVVIVEFSLDAPQARLGNGPTERVAISGRQVRLRRPTKTNPNFAADWKTERARYTLVANGTSPTTMRRFISCLP
jgi:hypothetical protein